MIPRAAFSFDHPAWRWIIQIGGETPEGTEFEGYAETFEEAKAAFARDWRIWLDYAALTEVDALNAPSAARRT